jgi:hypothetical protein
MSNGRLSGTFHLKQPPPQLTPDLPDGNARILLQSIKPAIRDHASMSGCSSQARLGLDQENPGAGVRLFRADCSADSGGTSANHYNIVG